MTRHLFYCLPWSFCSALCAPLHHDLLPIIDPRGAFWATQKPLPWGVALMCVMLAERRFSYDLLTSSQYYFIALWCPLSAVFYSGSYPLHEFIIIMPPHLVIHILFAWHLFSFELIECQPITDTQPEPVIHPIGTQADNIINHPDL